LVFQHCVFVTLSNLCFQNESKKTNLYGHDLRPITVAHQTKLEFNNFSRARRARRDGRHCFSIPRERYSKSLTNI
jgi:hypothetical protein